MTTIDHAAEALDHIHSANIAAGHGECASSDLEVKTAQVHATLALVEAQREANEIARIQVMLALPGTPEQMREAPVDEQGRERMDRILKGLGL